MIFGLLLAAASVLGTPCTAVSPDCTEWIKPGGQQSRVLIYRNYPLETKNENITRALIFVHGINRDADNHFRTVLAAAFLAGALNNTIIVSPRFVSNSGAPGNQIGDCRDALAPDEPTGSAKPRVLNSVTVRLPIDASSSRTFFFGDGNLFSCQRNTYLTILTHCSRSVRSFLTVDRSSRNSNSSRDTGNSTV